MTLQVLASKLRTRSKILMFLLGTLGLSVAAYHFLSSSLNSQIGADQLLKDLMVGLPNADPNEFIMVVVFSPYDCSKCLQEAIVWKRIQTLFEKRLTIIGIARIDKSSIIEQFAETYGLRFPILLDSNNELAERFLGENFEPKRFFFKNSRLLRTDPVGIEPGSEAEKELIDWITNEAPS